MPAVGRRHRAHRLVAVVVAALLLLAGGIATVLPGRASAADLVPVQILGITDLHGYLSEDSGQTIPGPDGTLQVGGIANMQALVDDLRGDRPHSFLIGSGDEFSGWPKYTSAFSNEPTVEALNRLGLQFDVPGNHEFDREFPFLQRMMSGKCFGSVGIDSCFTDSSGHRFAGTDYGYYSANIRDSRGRHVLPPYWITHVTAPDGTSIAIGFIGLTTPTTPTDHQLSIGGSGFDFTDLAEEANAAAAELTAKGVETIVVSMHEGGSQQSGGGYNDCNDPAGPLFDAVARMSPDIDAVLGGHWHTAFTCMLPDPAGNVRPVMEAANHGKLVAEINLAIDPATGDVVRTATTATNHPVLKTVTPDPRMQGIVDYWVGQWGELADSPLTRLTGDLDYSPTAESAMTNLAADLYFRQARQPRRGDADFALIPVASNLDVVRHGVTAGPGGAITFGDAYGGVGIAPIVTLTLTGRDIEAILEEQWIPQQYGCTRSSLLAVSHNTRYTYDLGRPAGDRVDPASVSIDGRRLRLGRTYHVATSASMAVSHDSLGFPSFENYTKLVRAPERGQEVYLKYLRSHGRVVPPAVGRVTRVAGTAPAEEGPFGPLTLLDRSGVTATATSQGNAANAPAKGIDGDCSTIWHSSWSPKLPLPQWITLDLGSSQELEALVYTPRQDGGTNGQIWQYEVQVSDDGETFTAAASGTWAHTADPKIARFAEPVTTRYVRIVGLAGGANYASAAEVNLALATG